MLVNDCYKTAIHYADISNQINIIHVLTYNQFQLLIQNIQSIRKFHAYENNKVN